jgi:mRNA interferase RelE/StbE
VQIEFKERFLKDLSKISNPYAKKIETFVFEEAEKLESINTLSGVKKMKGYSNFYRVRFGEYRVGFQITDDGILSFMRVLHRRDIYRYFP